MLEVDERLSVLDGQQRLQALFDFIDDKFRVARFEPFDNEIDKLVGARFSELPAVEQRRIKSTRISAYRLYDYQPDEPYELFFRLNLPTALTQAEKRNALAGTTRRQVRAIVDKAVTYGWDKELLGFSDGRLAYDDVVARVCAFVERGTLATQLNSREMETLYRDEAGLQTGTVEVVTRAIEHLTSEIRSLQTSVRFNKATLLTWLLVTCRTSIEGVSASIRLREAIQLLEGGRALVGRRDIDEVSLRFEDAVRTAPLVSLYVDRSSLRVTDVLSVLARDAIAWLAVVDTNSRSAIPPVALELQDRVGRLPFKGEEAFEYGVLELVSSWDRWSRLQ